ncbi:MAG: hypothetical protein ACREC3_16155 [Methyloceanibacter sp.]
MTLFNSIQSTLPHRRRIAMASKERSYTATGRTVVAFETEHKGNQAVGVGVNGTECGVHGEGGLNPLGTRTHPAFTGVHGRGDITGVAGEGGMIGAMFKGVVVGCHSEGGLGVISKGSIVGTYAEGTFGVLSKGTFVGIDAESNIFGITAKGGIGAGVTAISETAAGVNGISQSGPGVEGQSEQNRGGVFESGEIAQIQLIPSSKLLPPATGKVGDLFINRDIREPNLPSGVNLYLCVRDGSKQAPALWAPVQLGTIVPGQ